MVRWLLASTLGMTLFSATAFASQIQSQKMDSFTFVSIDGPIVSGDAEKFRQVALGTSGNVVVGLDSDGGSVVESLDIARLVKLMGYSTAVLDDLPCNSACAFIWLAGSKRILQQHARVGFHASYLDTQGGVTESGMANALVGQFYASLNLSETAIIFATEASPSTLNYLTVDNAASIGIPVNIITSDAKTQAKAATPSDNVPAWIHSIYANGWTLKGVSTSSDVLMFVRQPLGESPTGLPRLWVRMENEKPDNDGHLSSQSLEEYNCANGQVRTYEMTLFSLNNLTGETSNLPSTASQWTNIVPDSLAAGAYHTVCH